jgi:sugar lactone lactonase YvrE
MSGCHTPSPSCQKPGPDAKLFVELPSYCNTPDGMSIQPDKSIILSVPNFNDEKSPPLLVKISADGKKVDKFYEFPTPYPGLEKGVDRIGPMGISRAPNGDLYLADMQYMKNTNQKSRLWKFILKNGKVDKVVLVASGFNVANGTIVHNGYCYITESVLEEGSHPLTSAVMRFKLDEQNVVLTTPLKNDPHVIATFKSYKNDWRFGADGIAFDSKGNLFIGLFGEGVLYKLEFDKAGNVISNKEFAKAPGMLNNDGMACDLRTDKLYLADSAANAIRIIHPDGSISTLAQNGDVTDKRTGLLDQPCEAQIRGNEIIASNMDWPFPKMRNSKHQMPATLSIMKIK